MLPLSEETQPSHFFPLGLGPGVGGLLRVREIIALVPYDQRGYDSQKKN